MDTSSLKEEEDSIFYRHQPPRTSPLPHFHRPLFIDRVDVENFVDDFELLFASVNLLLFCENIETIGLFATAGKLAVLECQDGPLYTVMTLYLSSPGKSSLPSRACPPQREDLLRRDSEYPNL